ncbi:MAG: hypothetical protein ACRDWB_02095 [Acidimicrobiales bacterium]
MPAAMEGLAAEPAAVAVAMAAFSAEVVAAGPAVEVVLVALPVRLLAFMAADPLRSSPTTPR